MITPFLPTLRSRHLYIREPQILKRCEIHDGGSVNLKNAGHSGIIHVKSQVKILLLSLLLVLVSPKAIAEIYKWIDRNGGIVYSQSRPPADATILKTPQIIYPSGDSEAASNAVEAIIRSEKEARNKREARQQQKKDVQKKVAGQKEVLQSCKRSRKNLETLENRGHIYIMESGGNKRFLNPKELSLKTQEAKEIINNYCPEY